LKCLSAATSATGTSRATIVVTGTTGVMACTFS
jgi:hypothetical protein